MDPSVMLGSAVVGLLVGVTGAGGGALMTPMLILLFGMKPSTAVSSDLVAAVFMRPMGAAVHLRRGTVNLRLVGLLSAGSVPMALVGSWLLHVVGHARAAEGGIERALGGALLLGAGAMVLRTTLDRRTGQHRTGTVHQLSLRPGPTMLVGMAGGLVVGFTSVGSGSLVILLLLFLYPTIGATQLVGTDLAQAVPLTLAAALGALALGHVAIPVTASVVAGGVPAVLVGSLVSSRAPDRLVRPAITFVILATGLKYLGVPTVALGWALCAVLLAAGTGWAALARPWARRPAAGEAVAAVVRVPALAGSVGAAPDAPRNGPVDRAAESGRRRAGGGGRAAESGRRRPGPGAP